MKHNASISKINEPVWFIESKPCQEVPWCIIPKGCISKASTAEVEVGCNYDCYCWGLLHGLVFWWRWLQSILHVLQNASFIPASFTLLKRISPIWDMKVSNLYLNNNERVWIGKCNVSKSLRYQPYFISCTRSWNSFNASLSISISCNIYDKEIISFWKKS